MLKTFDDVKLFEDVDHSLERIALQKRICGFAMLSPHNSFCALSGFSPAETDFPADLLSDTDKSEILSHLNSFSDKILLCEIGEKLCAFLPSLYPSSSLCLALIFDGGQFSTSQLLRLIACDECPDIFALSDSLKSRAARISDSLIARAECFFEICRKLHDGLLDLGAPFDYGDRETYAALAKRMLLLSELIGCRVDSLRFEKEANLSSLFDLPLLLSFVITFMLFALNDTPSRSLGISLSDMSGELLVKLTFACKNEALSLPLLEWEAIASDKNMFFEVYEEDEQTYVSFQPTRRDWSYLGLKQNTDFI